MLKIPETGLEILVPGSTSNLGAGFDTFGLALRVYLRLRVRPADAFHVVLSGEGESELARDTSNLVLKTYLRACEQFNLPAKSIALEIHNDIPLKRGLGSSGAAIAAGLHLASLQSETQLPMQQLLELGCEIEGHPENLVASMLGGFCVNCYDSGRLHYAQFTSLPAFNAVLLIPDLTISTEVARRLLPKSVQFADAVANVQRAGLMVAGLLGGDLALLRQAVSDTLHQPFRKKLIPGFDGILAAAYEAGANAAFLSGSGSTILALTIDPDAAERIAKALKAAAVEVELPARTKIVELHTSGVQSR